MDENTEFSFSELSDVAISKSNSVSFLKTDDLEHELRNILVVGESYICYSVTAKRTSIRAIDTITGEKALLKGHEVCILDLKRSVNDNASFCSVDNGSGTGIPHTIIWKRCEDKFDFAPVALSYLPAITLQSYPLGRIWAISNGQQIGFISGAISDPNVTSYAMLDLNIDLEGETTTGKPNYFHFFYSYFTDFSIAGFSFSADGMQLTAAMTTRDGQRYVQVWQLQGGVLQENNLRGGGQRWKKLFDRFHNQSRISGLMTVDFIGQLIVTVSKIDDEYSFGGRDTSNNSSSNLKMIPYALNVWKIVNPDNADVTLHRMQSVTVNFPVFQFRGKTTSLANPYLEVAVRVEPRNGRYLILSTRRSYIVGCFALSTPTTTASLPIYHVSLLHFKAPVVSMDLTTILGREHHSAEEGEHVEVTAYQEEAQDQSSIQQYHMLERSLYDHAQYKTLVELSAPRTIFSMLSNSSSKKSLEIAADNNNGGFEMQTMKANRETLESLQKQSSTNNKTSFSSPAVESNSDSKAVGSGLKRLDSSKLFTSPAAPAAAQAPAPSSACADDDDLPDFVKVNTPQQNTSILSMLGRAASSGKITTPAAAVVAPAPVAASAPAVIPPSPQVITSIPQTTAHRLVSQLKADMAATTPAAAAAAPLAAAPDSTSPLNPAAFPFFAPTTPAEVVPQANVGASPFTSVSGKGPTKIAVASILPKQPSQQQPYAIAANEGTTSNAATSDLINILQEMRNEMKQMNKTQASQKAEFDKLKANLVRDITQQQMQATTEIRQIMGTSTETQRRIVAETMQAVKAEIATQVTETLQNKILPSLTQKLKESVKDSAKETIKTHLQDYFRTAFESSLLPAFQSGIDRLFEQINSSVDSGLQSVFDANAEQSRNQTETVSLSLYLILSRLYS